MGASPDPDEKSLANVRRFLGELNQTFGGISEAPERAASLDRNLQGREFCAFNIINRGNNYVLQVPNSDLPDSACDDTAVILDGEPALWRDALSLIRSRPSRN